MIELVGQERVAPILMTALAGIGLVPLVLASGEPSKEILYPVATVILGGLVSSTLLDFFVRPALFWCFGRQAAEQQIAEGGHDELSDEPHSPPPTTAHAAKVATNLQGVPVVLDQSS